MILRYKMKYWPICLIRKISHDVKRKVILFYNSTTPPSTITDNIGNDVMRVTINVVGGPLGWPQDLLFDQLGTLEANILYIATVSFLFRRFV